MELETLNGTNGASRLSVPIAEHVAPAMVSKGTRRKHRLDLETRNFLLNEINQRGLDRVVRQLQAISHKPLGACRTQLNKMLSEPGHSWSTTSRNLFGALHKLFAEQRKARAEREAQEAGTTLKERVAAVRAQLDAEAAAKPVPAPRKRGRPLGAKNKPKPDALAVVSQPEMNEVLSELKKTRADLELLKEQMARVVERPAPAPALPSFLSQYAERYERIVKFVEASKEPLTEGAIRSQISETAGATKKILERGIREGRIKRVINPWTSVYEYWRAR